MKIQSKWPFQNKERLAHFYTSFYIYPLTYLIGGLNLVLMTTSGNCWITWLISNWEKNIVLWPFSKTMQIHIKTTIFNLKMVLVKKFIAESEKSFHFVNLLSFAKRSHTGHFFLSLILVMWSNSPPKFARAKVDQAGILMIKSGQNILRTFWGLINILCNVGNYSTYINCYHT